MPFKRCCLIFLKNKALIGRNGNQWSIVLELHEHKRNIQILSGKGNSRQTGLALEFSFSLSPRRVPTFISTIFTSPPSNIQIF